MDCYLLEYNGDVDASHGGHRGESACKVGQVARKSLKH